MDQPMVIVDSLSLSDLEEKACKLMQEGYTPYRFSVASEPSFAGGLPKSHQNRYILLMVHRQFMWNNYVDPLRQQVRRVLED